MKTFLINGAFASTLLKIELPETFPDINGVKEDKFGVKLSEINTEDVFRTTNNNLQWGKFR